MRVLFDQGTPAPLWHLLVAHDVSTAYERGWSVLKNGELLAAAEQDAFQILLTTDMNLRYQQNLASRNDRRRRSHHDKLAADQDRGAIGGSGCGEGDRWLVCGSLHPMTLFRRLFLLLILSCITPAGATEAVVTEGTVDAPVAHVWAAFTTGEGLRSWMAPHADIDLRVDGLMRANYRAEGALGDASTIVNRVLSFEPLRMLSIRVAKAPEDFPFPVAIQAMWTVIHFDALADARTRLRVVSMSFTPDDESQRMKAFFERGNAFTVTRLQEKFRK